MSTYVVVNVVFFSMVRFLLLVMYRNHVVINWGVVVDRGVLDLRDVVIFLLVGRFVPHNGLRRVGVTVALIVLVLSACD